METIYDNNSFINFVLNDFVKIWVISSDDGMVLNNIDEIIKKSLLP